MTVINVSLRVCVAIFLDIAKPGQINIQTVATAGSRGCLYGIWWFDTEQMPTNTHGGIYHMLCVTSDVFRYLYLVLWAERSPSPHCILTIPSVRQPTDNWCYCIVTETSQLLVNSCEASVINQQGQTKRQRWNDVPYIHKGSVLSSSLSESYKMTHLMCKWFRTVTHTLQ